MYKSESGIRPQIDPFPSKILVYYSDKLFGTETQRAKNRLKQIGHFCNSTQSESAEITFVKTPPPHTE